jgi:hypothetical protein
MCYIAAINCHKNYHLSFCLFSLDDSRDGSLKHSGSCLGYSLAAMVLSRRLCPVPLTGPNPAHTHPRSGALEGATQPCSGVNRLWIRCLDVDYPVLRITKEAGTLQVAAVWDYLN